MGLTHDNSYISDISQLRLDQLKLMNYTMTVDEDKVMATVNTSGLNYSDFDGKSKLSL